MDYHLSRHRSDLVQAAERRLELESKGTAVNYLYAILIALNIFAIGVLGGVWYADHRLEEGCEKEMLYTNIRGEEYTCLKMPRSVLSDYTN